jgi:hypothetical protein
MTATDATEHCRQELSAWIQREKEKMDQCWWQLPHWYRWLYSQQ